MTEQQQIKNIIAFLAIIFGESTIWHEEIMNFNPDYLIEKFKRYIKSTENESDWGLHPELRNNVFNYYCHKHGIICQQYEDIE